MSELLSAPHRRQPQRCERRSHHYRRHRPRRSRAGARSRCTLAAFETRDAARLTPALPSTRAGNSHCSPKTKRGRRA
eukprot:1836310-Pleurochrysis_carterae.AAC.1